MAIHIQRREFIVALGGAATACPWPLAARAQQPAMPVIGLLGANTPSVESQWVAAFVQRLRELGWIEGRTVKIEYRWAEGRAERAAELAAEFVRLKVDVIVTYANMPALAAKQATAAIPIVFATAADPLGTGLVASLAHPGVNVTGSSIQQSDLASKRVELLRELVPNLRQLPVMADVRSPNAVLAMREVQTAASMLGFEMIPVKISQAEDIAPGFEAIKAVARALYVPSHPLVFTNRARIHTLAMAARLPTLYDFREYVEAGGLMSYGPNITDFFPRAAEFVDKILRGTQPADIPVEQPTKFDLVINLTLPRRSV